MRSLAVVVPSIRRPDALVACLDGLGAQERSADEVVVVTRTDDEATASVARDHPARCRVVQIDEPGVLAAMAAGARSTTSEVVCFTDDDAVAPPSWLARVDAAFDASALVGGVGGRDVIVEADGSVRDEELTDDVGRLTWFGRHVGNHHRATGPPRDVAFLKGVNSAYRREALGLPTTLRGTGAQAHFEIAVGRFARSRGYRLVFDPSLTVEHRPGARVGEDLRDVPTTRAVADAAYNLVVCIGGGRGLARVLYATAVGDRGVPGVARGIAAVLSADRATARRTVPSIRGTVAGGAALVTGRGVRYETFS